MTPIAVLCIDLFDLHSSKMETIITINLPLKRVEKSPLSTLFKRSTFARVRSRFYGWGGGSVQEFGGSRVNTIRHLSILGWHVLTLRRNEYHDRSDAERAAEYLAKWSEAEKELRDLRLLQMGDEVTDPELRKLLRDGLGVDLDEGTC